MVCQARIVTFGCRLVERIQARQFDACISSGKLSMHGSSGLIANRLPLLDLFPEQTSMVGGGGDPFADHTGVLPLPKEMQRTEVRIPKGRKACTVGAIRSDGLIYSMSISESEVCQRQNNKCIESFEKTHEPITLGSIRT
jgi:hypothetical protein